MNTQTLPFLNKYFRELEYPYLTWHNGDKFNEALLVLEPGVTFSKKPFIEEMSSGTIQALAKWFTTFPIHKTNRIRWTLKQKSETDLLITDYIKPKIIISFSDTICRQIAEEYPLYSMEQYADSTIWKGIIKINGLFFSFYSLPGISDMNEIPEDLTWFMVYTITQRNALCRQLNTIIGKHSRLKLPDNPLGDLKVRKYLENVKDFAYPRLINIIPHAAESITRSIPDYDIYDIIISTHLKDFMPHESVQIPLSLKEYKHKRTSHSSETIAGQYFEPVVILYKKEIVQLSLIRLHCYLYHPQLSFEADWGLKMAEQTEMKDIIRGHIKSHMEMMQKMSTKDF